MAEAVSSYEAKVEWLPAKKMERVRGGGLAAVCRVVVVLLAMDGWGEA